MCHLYKQDLQSVRKQKRHEELGRGFVHDAKKGPNTPLCTTKERTYHLEVSQKGALRTLGNMVW